MVYFYNIFSLGTDEYINFTDEQCFLLMSDYY